MMQLVMDKRGEIDHTETLDTRRVMMTCVLPLNEILVDFNDKIKSMTRGYGSMDYEYVGLQATGQTRQARHPRERRAGGRVSRASSTATRPRAARASRPRNSRK